MNFNATLYGQIIAFGFFVWFCVQYIWPRIIKGLDARQAKIADGLAAGEKGKQELASAQQEVAKILSESKGKAQELINQGQKRHDEIVNEAKEDAAKEGVRILNLARDEIAQDQEKAKVALRAEVSALVMVAAEKILMREVDKKSHDEVLNKISAEF